MTHMINLRLTSADFANLVIPAMKIGLIAGMR